MCSFNDLLVKLRYCVAISLPSVSQRCGTDLQDIVKQTRYSGISPGFVSVCFLFRSKSSFRH